MNKYMNIIQTGIIILIIAIINLGCSVTHSVKTSSTVTLSKRLKSEVPAIKSIKYTFTRPDLTIHIEMKEVPTENAVNTILENVKQFSSIENINEIAKSVNWNSEISDVNLIIRHSEENVHIKYFARYFKTFDGSDTSDENIDGYKTWIKYEEVLD